MHALIERKKEQLAEQGFIEFSHDEIDHLKLKEIEEIESHFQGHTLMRLPIREIEFFEWLKENDYAVWEDLWGGDDEPYQVSTDFLHHFIGEGKGFPICDLVDVDNYWFNVRHIKPKAREKIDEINHKLNHRIHLDLQESLLLEIMSGSIDIWHFCYRLNISIERAKNAVADLSSADMLVHLTNRDDLVKYLDF